MVPEPSSQYSPKLHLTIRGPNLPGVPDIEVDLTNPDWTVFKAVQDRVATRIFEDFGVVL